jgi:hypothetical protein
MRLGLVSGKDFVPFDLDIPAAFDLEDRRISARYLPVYSGSKSVLIDFDAQTLLALRDKDQLLAQADNAVLLKRELTIVRVLLPKDHAPVALATPEAKAEHTVLDGVAPGTALRMAEGFAYVAPYVLSASPLRLVAPFRAPEGVIALSNEGCVLVATPPTIPSNYARGPLHWVCPDSPRDDVNALRSARTVMNRRSGSIANACSTQSSTSGRNSGRSSVSFGRAAVVAAR